jgi:hypothetical protein
MIVVRILMDVSRMKYKHHTEQKKQAMKTNFSGIFIRLK